MNSQVIGFEREAGLEYDFFDSCKKHDIMYAYSDDHQVWQRGQEERKKINERVALHPQLGWIWKRYTSAVNKGIWPKTLEELRDD